MEEPKSETTQLIFIALSHCLIIGSVYSASEETGKFY